ncbi:MAG TPA: trypsin-like peptidase domain-containing protein [Pirellulaceae bacterium]|nr:trypsin-like peptidase domain-containing protein [Pirellulaceae bacterium]
MLQLLRRTRWALTLSIVIGALVTLPTLGLRPVVAAEMTVASPLLERIFAGEPPQSVADLKEMQGHLQKLSEQLIPCTVGVRVGAAQGSGVIISKDGYVLTAAHVVGKPNIDVTFILPDGRTAKGRTLGMNRTIDAGLMKITDDAEKIIQKPSWPFVEMGASADLKEGQWCVATGHPGGYERGRQPVVRFGRVLQNHDTVIMTDCTLVGGDSGGPLFDMQGRVIGINSRIAGPLNANMHVPVNTFRDTWDRLVAAEAWGSMAGNAPFLGVQGDPESKDAKIAKVFPGTPAEQAGLKVGDLVLKVDGQEITEFAKLSSLVGDKSPGDKMKLQVKRGEETLEIEVTIGKRSE